MKVAFTLCSLNYMHQAITLGQTLLEHNPDFKFIIGLVDKIDQRIDKNKLPTFEILEVETIMQPKMLQDLVNRYDIIELNTSVKPFYFEYLFENYNPEYVIYFDPDIAIYDGLFDIDNNFKSSKVNIILTPHINHPPPQKFEVHEWGSIATGIYNLGFIAVKNTIDVIEFLKWWQNYVFTKGYNNPSKNLFYDQLCMNLVPIYFDKVYIEKNMGHNVAGWNIYQRKIVKNEGKYLMENKSPLIFFHFSGLRSKDRNYVSKYNDYTITKDSPIYEIISNYIEKNKSNNEGYFKNISCFYKTVKLTHERNGIYKSVHILLNKTIGACRKLLTILKNNA